MSAISNVTQNDFLQLLVAQLQNQDPLSPADPTQSVTQLAQFSELQSVQNLGASFDQMLSLQQLSSGTNLVGKTIQFTDSSNQTETGTVSALSVSNGNVSLTVGSSQVPLTNVTGVLSS
jgi:flagellar basal-body rod modification protein FlgD